MKLHKNKSLFIDAIRFTAQQMNLQPEFIEKDYWVVYALYTIFNDKIGEEVVFKGGTALSKCYNIIERFSEDIDLVIIKREGESESKLKAKLKAISSVVDTVLPEVDIDGITRKMGMNRKTAHNYIKEFKGDYGQARDKIILESAWLGYHEPYTTKSIISFVGQMMLYNKQSEIASANGLLPFDLYVLKPERTICEKIMSLIRFSYSENPVDDLNKKIRHTYDLHQLLKQEEYLEFFQSKKFEEILLKVAHDDMISFKNNNEWLKKHPREALIFKELENIWKVLRNTYDGEFKNLVYGELPKEKDVLQTLKMIQNRITRIQWLTISHDSQ